MTPKVPSCPRVERAAVQLKARKRREPPRILQSLLLGTPVSQHSAIAFQEEHAAEIHQRLGIVPTPLVPAVAHGAAVVGTDVVDTSKGVAVCGAGFLSSALGMFSPQHQPPMKRPCTTTRLPSTSAWYILSRRPWGLTQLGNSERLCRRGECSRKAAPRLNRLMRWRDSVYMSVNGPLVAVAFRNASEGLVSPPNS